MTFIVTVNRNEEPAVTQLENIAEAIRSSFPDKVRVEVMDKMATLLLDFSVPVTIEEVRNKLSAISHIRQVEDDGSTSSVPHEIESLQ